MKNLPHRFRCGIFFEVMGMYLIKELPAGERPRERLEQCGAAALSATELLAILLRTGTDGMSVLEVAESILREVKDPAGLRDRTVEELAAFRGVGRTKAVTVLAALELGKRALSDTRDSPRLASAADVFRLLKDDLSDLRQEVLVALYLDLKGGLIAKRQLFVGGLNQSLVHPREIFKYAVKYSAHSVILAHNHPSGDPEPSRQDLEVTAVLEEAGEMLQIRVADHVVIAKDRYVSIAEYRSRIPSRRKP